MLRRGTRPARGEIDEAALELLARHGGQILATARRYATTPEDAEDAYQRALEILLTKAPTTNEEELVPWLKTVVKHEAFSLRRQRERHSPVTDDGHLSERPTSAAITHDHAERFEQLSQGAEALRELKPQEIRALLLRAEGYSYREICDITGWTYTKVNRCLTEGRRAFLGRVAAIRGGEECERLIPVLSAVADGEAGADELALLRPHMKTCLSCRARLKEFRALPARVAALTPVALLAAQDAGVLRTLVESAFAGAQQKAEGVLGATQQKAALFGERAHMAAELATAQKLAAVAASAAALAGGGSAIDQFANHRGPPPARAIAAKETKQAKKQDVALVKKAAGRAVRQLPIQPAPEPSPQPAPTPTRTPQPQQAAPRRPAPRPDPANEFAPAPLAAGQATPTPTQTFEPAGVSASAPAGTTQSDTAGPGSTGSGPAAPQPVAGSQSEFAP